MFTDEQKHNVASFMTLQYADLTIWSIIVEGLNKLKIFLSLVKIKLLTQQNGTYL